ncbi:MAG: hypothetical protein DMG56_08490 [Acidobacteria bacterium]|nr:MAG: hypothetical protein DMG56_08490 [Acidobacteriota bacterium]
MMALRRGGHSGLGLVLGKAGCLGRGTNPRPGRNRCPPCKHQERCRGKTNGWLDSTVGLLIILADGAIPIELAERRTLAHAIDKSRRGK